MIDFSELVRVAPGVAAPIRSVFEARGLGMLGTSRADGSPRVSPVEVTIVDDHLYVGMMPGSRKERDVARDPRCALLTPVADRDDLGGEGKIFGVVRRIEDADEARQVLLAALAHLDVDVDSMDGSPMYEVFVTGAAWQYVADDTWVTRLWNPGAGFHVWHRVGPTGLPVEVE